MNYLAHLLLAGDDRQWQLGGFLGDHVKGGDWENYPPTVAAGILLHRAIDQRTDSHPCVVQLKAELPPRFRRYGGIILDILFDHLLATQWVRWHHQPLPEFAAQVYQLLRREHDLLPVSGQRFSRHLESHDLLVNYADEACLPVVFSGVSKRLTRSNPLADATEVLQHAGQSLKRAFSVLLPDLLEFSWQYRRRAADQLG